MAIAFKAAGARTKVDVATLPGAGSTTVSVALPAGHASGDWLVLVYLADNNSNPPTPAGWTLLGISNPGSSTQSPYAGRPRLIVWHRIDNGSLGSTVDLSVSTQAWAIGDPYLIAFTAAYTGVDSTGPIETWAETSTLSDNPALAHPQLTTAVSQDWLLTIRAASSGDTAQTFTISGGTNSERVDDNDGFNELGVALYDSNGGLSTGLQTQRTTTSSDGFLEYGSAGFSIALKPASTASVVNASAETASAVGTAYDASVVAVSGPWDLCAVGGLPQYSFEIDWDGDGAFSGTDDVTGDLVSDISSTYGRDQDRQLSPAAVGSAAFTLNNTDGRYYPDASSSPLYGDLEPAREMRAQVVYDTTTYPITRGRIDDYDLRVDRTNRTVEFTFLDGLNDLQGVKLSTGVYVAMRTGALIETILDLAGWTGGRDIDLGATVVPFWWAEGVDCFAAINDLVKSEGPPSIAYVGPDGTFVFRDRHHRLLRSESINVQAEFSAAAVACDSPASTGLDFTAPFTYAHGWRDIINSVSFEIPERVMSGDREDVWTSDDTISLSTGQSMEIDISTSDPFMDAVTPESGTDYTATGAGTLAVTLSRTSGQSVKITLLAVGGSVVVSALKLRAKPITTRKTVKVTRQDTGSISRHGERAYPEAAPWANANDADAIAGMILLQYAQRRPTVQLRVVSQNPEHFVQLLTRTISDRIHITNAEASLDADFFVERVTHTIRRINQDGKPPVHAVVFGCERDLVSTANPFRFDVRGAGFDQGVFDPITADNASTVFIFDHPTQGVFDTGMFGT